VIPVSLATPWRRSSAISPLTALALAAGLVGCARMMTAPVVQATATSLHNGTAAARQAWMGSSELPDRTEVVAGQLVIHADFPLAGQHRLVRDLEALRADVSQELGLPISDEPVQLYLFEDPARYESFAAAHFPGFPSRRAFFVETDTTLSVFAPWQDRIAEDLRHETTHGYVHAVLPSIPLWLDEGVAEFFELPRGDQGLHRDHVAHLSGRLLEGTWRADIDRMEALESAAELSQDHYAEAWCWVHWLLRTTPDRRKLLQDYLTDLRRDPKTAPLSARLRQAEGSPAALAAAVRGHLEQIAATTDDR
jgi:hypothetical protein